MFPRLRYLEWMQGRPEVALYDLGSSDLRGDRDHGPVVVPESLEGVSDPPVGATVELQLAQQYGVEPEEVLVTSGATTANVLAAAATVRLKQRRAESADEESEHPRILVEKPAYEPLVRTPRGIGASVDRFLREDEYRLDPERVTAAMTPDTGLVTITNRHNPSGRLTEREILETVASVVREGGARLLVDEVYAPFVETENVADATDVGTRAFGGITAAGLEGTVVTSSLTKFHGLGDLSIGWLIADEAFVDAARAIEHHVGSVSGPSRALARRALHNTADLESDARTLLEQNTALLAEFVDSRPDVRGTVYPGSTFAFLEVAGLNGDEVTAAAWEQGILVVPGRFFDDPARIRVSLGRDPEAAAAGLEAFGTLLDDLVEGDARRTEP